MKINSFFICLSFSVLLIINSCGGKQQKYESPEGYDLTAPEKMTMKESLLEISGITFHNDDTILALNDEEGRIFFVPWMGTKNRIVKFAHNGDFEDVTKYKNQILALRSDGAVFSFPDSVTQRTKAKKVGKTLPKGDYEGLYADELEGKLYVLCKRCESEKIDDSTIRGFILELKNDSITEMKTFEIVLSSHPKFKSDKKKKSFAPSAIAKNKQTNEWYILSAVNKTLLIADTEWNVKQLFEFDPDLFNQPEGIAFDRDNNLYISNEGDELQNGNVLKFVHRNSSQITDH